MLRYLFTLFLFFCSLTIGANEGSSRFFTENISNFTIKFDDFPDNSIPDFDSIDESGPIPKKFEFDSVPDDEDTIDQQSEFGVVNYEFPSAMVNGVNVLSGEFQEAPTDFALPGAMSLNVQRYYSSGDSKKQSLYYGWRLSHGAKLFTRHTNHFRVFVKGSDRHGVLFRAENDCQAAFLCPASFFKKSVTNCSLGEICANNNFKNDQLCRSREGFKLCTARHSHYWFVKSSHDPEHIHNSKTHSYRLEKMERPDGSSYRYIYSQPFGMPTSISLLDRQGTKVAGLNLEKIPDEVQFLNHPKITYLTSTGEKLSYRFKVYDLKRRAILSEVEPPHAPKIKYDYLPFRDHEKKKKLCKRELPDQRVLEIGYNHKGKVKELISPAGGDNKMITTHTFHYYKDFDARWAVVTNARKGIKEYFWTSRSKRLDAIVTYESGEPIFKERFRWGDSKNDKSHLTARILEEGDGQLITFEKYQYYPDGNISGLFLYGNLTGEHEDPIFIGNNLESPSKSACDLYRISYTYDAKKRRETEENGRTLNQYKYLADTDLVSAQYTSYNGRIQIRRFYEYDASGAISQEIIDDGSVRPVDDLSGVTERRIKNIKNTPLGLPEITEECALNLQTGQIQSIRHTVNQYDHHGWLRFQSVYDYNGSLAYTLEWDYDSHGNVNYEKDAMGNVTVSNYDDNDNLVYESKPDLAPCILTYDFMNRLTGETWEASKKESLHKSYHYDPMGNCISSRDIYGKKTTYEYDSHGRLIRITYPKLHHSHEKPSQTYIRNGQGLATSITDAKNNALIIVYNPRGKPISTTFPDDTIEKRTYTLWGELAECIARDGTKIEYKYDPQGRERSKEWFDSYGNLIKTTTKEYDAFHLTVETDGNGIKTYYTYDPTGRLETKKIKKRLTRYAYDNLGRLKTTTKYLKDKTSISYEEEYDALDRVIKSYTICPDGEFINQVSKRYDAQGNEIWRQEQNQAGKAIIITRYDLFGRVESVTNPLEETILTTYQLDGKTPRLEIVDARGVKTSTTYDAFGHPVLEQRYDPMGKLVEETTFEYDVNGNKILRRVTTDKQPVETQWHYNALNQLKETIEAVGTPDQKCIERNYDAAGRLKTLTKNDGIILSYTYDALGRKRTLKSSNGMLYYSYRYDNNGNLKIAKDKINRTAIHRTYNAYDQLKSDTLPSESTLTYAYDYLGNVRQITLPDQTKIRYKRKGDRLLEIQREGPLAYSFNYTKYDPSSNPTRMRLPAKAGKLRIDYDLINRPINISSPQWEETLKYDAQLLDNCTLHDTFGKTVSSYTYDAREQLLTENGVAEHQLEYDWQGNIEQYNGHAREFNARNALVNHRKKTYTYDLNGNRTSDGVNTYHYDALDRLIKVETPSGIYNYTYDALGRRVSSTYKKKTTYFLWQQQQEIGSFSSNGKIQELQVLNPSNRPIAFELHDVLYTPITDTFGHVRALLDADGNSVSTYRYSAFGKEEIKGKVLSPWRYAGKRIDAETGFIYFGKRHYDPKTLCWMTPDPLEDIDGPNHYAYVKNNPLYYVDPDGRFVIAIPLLAWGGAAGITTVTISLKAIAGAVIGAVLGVVVYQVAPKLENAVNKDKETSSKNEEESSDKNARYRDPNFPGNDADLEKHPDWKETTHPSQKEAGHREFINGKTGDKIRFDKGDPNNLGHEAHDHYHRYNPNARNRHEAYLDINGKPVGRGSDASHLYPPRGINWEFK